MIDHIVCHVWTTCYCRQPVHWVADISPTVEARILHAWVTQRHKALSLTVQYTIYQTKNSQQDQSQQNKITQHVPLCSR